MNKRGLVNHSFEGDNKNRLPSFLPSVQCGMRTGSAVGCRRSSGHGAQEAENIGKDETDKDLSGRFPLWPPAPLLPSLSSPPTSGDGMLFIQAGTQSQAEVVGWRLQ